jgi:hypothetical protein
MSSTRPADADGNQLPVRKASGVLSIVRSTYAVGARWSLSDVAGLSVNPAKTEVATDPKPAAATSATRAALLGQRTDPSPRTHAAHTAACCAR